MPKLYTSPGSPYGRKARLAILWLGLGERVQVVAAQTSNPEDPIHKVNPLHKMPALTTEDGAAIYDSPVILEYLDWLAGGGRILPLDSAKRFQALTLQALADGIADANALVRYEARWHDEGQISQRWLAHQQKKVDDGLDTLDRKPPAREGLDVGQIALACALGFIEKHDGAGWRSNRPTLAGWFDEFARRTPAFGQTAG